MGKKRNDDEATVNWTRQNERALLLRLVDHQTTALGRHPTAADWDRWAEEIFGKGVHGERCKQKRNRLRKIFQLYSVLINASGLGWDSETWAVHCEAAYLDDFLAVSLFTFTGIHLNSSKYISLLDCWSLIIFIIRCPAKPPSEGLDWQGCAKLGVDIAIVSQGICNRLSCGCFGFDSFD